MQTKGRSCQEGLGQKPDMESKKSVIGLSILVDCAIAHKIHWQLFHTNYSIHTIQHFPSPDFVGALSCFQSYTIERHRYKGCYHQ